MTANYVACGVGNVDAGYSPIMWSEDGKKWEKGEGNFYMPSFSEQAMNGVAYNPIDNLWVACGLGNTYMNTSPVMWSEDGKKWEKGEGNFYMSPHLSYQAMNGVAYNPIDNLWVACGSGNTYMNTSPVMWSEDGKKWEIGEGDFYLPENQQEAEWDYQTMLGIAYNPTHNLWVACGVGDENTSPLMWSNDGKKWEKGIGNFYSLEGIQEMSGVAYNPSNNLWVVSGKGNADTSPLMWSNDGKKWEKGSGDFYSLSGVQEMIGVVYNPSDNLWVSCGVGDENTSPVMWSNDGKKWEKGSGDFYNHWEEDYQKMSGVVYNPSDKLWIISGLGNVDSTTSPLMWSNDGKKWETGTVNPYSIVFDDNQYYQAMVNVAAKPGLVYTGT